MTDPVRWHAVSIDSLDFVPMSSNYFSVRRIQLTQRILPGYQPADGQLPLFRLWKATIQREGNLPSYICHIIRA